MLSDKGTSRYLGDVQTAQPAGTKMVACAVPGTFRLLSAFEAIPYAIV